MLTDTTNSLIETTRDGTATDADMNAAAQSFFDAISGASRDDANAALRTLSAHFNLENASRGAFLALVCGASVERGCDPLAIAKPLTERLASLLESSAELANACADQIPVLAPIGFGMKVLRPTSPSLMAAVQSCLAPRRIHAVGKHNGCLPISRRPLKLNESFLRTRYTIGSVGCRPRKARASRSEVRRDS